MKSSLFTRSASGLGPRGLIQLQGIHLLAWESHRSEKCPARMVKPQSSSAPIGGQLLHEANFTTLQVAVVRQGYYLEFGSFLAFKISFA